MSADVLRVRQAFADWFRQQPEFVGWQRANPTHDDFQVYEAYEMINARLSTMMYCLEIIRPKWLQHEDKDGKVYYAIHLQESHFRADPDHARFDSDDQLIWRPLAEVILELWRCQVQAYFPDKEIKIGLTQLRVEAGVG